MRPQRSGPFLCPSCDVYQNDDDWRYSSRDRSWRYRDRADERLPAAAAAGAAASDLADEDKAGLATNKAGAWHGPDDSADDASPNANDADSGTDDGDFDAS